MSSSTKRHNPPIDVKIELGERLAKWATTTTHPTTMKWIAEAASQIAQHLGWPVRPSVAVEHVDSHRAVRVRVRGRVRPYSPMVLQRVWSVTVPDGLEDVRGPGTAASGYPDAWLCTALEMAGRRGADPTELLARFLGTLTYEVMRSHPACLVDANSMSHYLGDARRSGPLAAMPLETAERVCREITEQGISLEPRTQVLSTLRWGLQHGLPADYLTEGLIDRLRLGRIEIQGPPATLRNLRLAGSAAEIQQRFEPLRALILADFGLNLPPVTVVQRTDRGGARVRINDLTGLPYPTVPDGYMLVLASPTELRERGIEGSATLDPVRWRPSVIVREDQATGAGEAYSPVDCVQLQVYGEVIMQLGRLLWMGAVEDDLYRIGGAVPPAAAPYDVLVRSVLISHSVADITRVMRSLLVEHGTIRNTRGILETLAAQTPNQPLADVYAAVRLALRDQLAYRAFAIGNGAVALRLDSRLERWATLAYSGLSAPDGDPNGQEELAERARDAVWDAFEGDAWWKVILASDSARPAVRALLAGEMPEVAVLAESELAGRPEDRHKPGSGTPITA